MVFRKPTQFEKRRVREILGRHGITQQILYYPFIRKLIEKKDITRSDLEECIEENVRKGLDREVLEELARALKPDLWTRRCLS